MARAIYPSELGDPDIVWLIETFKEARPGYSCLEMSCMPVVLMESVDLGEVTRSSTATFDYNSLLPVPK